MPVIYCSFATECCLFSIFRFIGWTGYCLRYLVYIAGLWRVLEYSKYCKTSKCSFFVSIGHWCVRKDLRWDACRLCSDSHLTTTVLFSSLSHAPPFVLVALEGTHLPCEGQIDGAYVAALYCSLCSFISSWLEFWNVLGRSAKDRRQQQCPLSIIHIHGRHLNWTITFKNGWCIGHVH